MATSSSSSSVQVVIVGANQQEQAANLQLTNNPIPDPTNAFTQYHLPLYEATLTTNWNKLKSFLINNPDAIKTKIAHNSGTVLHLAIATTKNVVFLKNLLDYVVSSGNSEVLRMKTSLEDTVLHYAAAFGNLEAAKLLVEKDPELLHMWNRNLFLPLHQAADSAKRSVFVYLFKKTRDNVSPRPFDGRPGIMLTVNLVFGGFCDMALEVVKKYPHLATRCTSLATTCTSLDAIALSPSYFRSGKRYNIWERIIYSGIPLNPTTPTTKSSSAMSPNSNEILVTTVCHKLLNLFWDVSAILVPRIKHLKAEKKLHHDSIEYVKFLCKELQKIDPIDAKPIFQKSSTIAATNGISEIIEEIAIASPTTLFLENNDPMISIFHIAVKHRHHNVFNLLFQTSFQRDVLLTRRAQDRTSILHMAATLPSSDRLNQVPGAPLQMQRELQWYKAVEQFVPQGLKTYPNDGDIKPATMFTEQHKDLVKEGETWMRDTANSCTIAATLISTIAFAAAITVPGGNNGDTGFPIFSKEVLFTIFAISNAISLFSSIASLVMFLAMLTARYSEEDFLYSLPRRLIIGLVTLFISITSMMVTFGATIYIVFSQKKRWILISVTVLGCLPVSLFVLLQFPLLIDMMYSTYGPGIFHKQGKRFIF
ncbi:hypothetical protein LUZ60_009533 [Juncus effusus]|nr:hypothetical protein LUZ60_009533 [Juncus effusus]